MPTISNRIVLCAVLATTADAFTSLQKHHALCVQRGNVRPLAHTNTHAAAPVTRRVTLAHASSASTKSAVLADMDDIYLDVGSLGRYLIAVLMQMMFITTVFGALDLYSYSEFGLAGPLPFPVVVGIFIALSACSRVFNPLDNSPLETRRHITMEDEMVLKELVASGNARPSRLRDECEKHGLLVDGTMDRLVLVKRIEAYFAEKEDTPASNDVSRDAAREQIVPSWTPPQIVNLVVPLTFVAPLRAFASSLVYETSSGRFNEGHLNDPILLWLVLHLCVADIYYTMNVVEKRKGAAVGGIALVWLTAVFAAKQFYDVIPLAGGLLSVTLVWLTVEAAVAADAWRLTDDAHPEPMYPYRRCIYKSVTRLIFDP